MMKETEAEEVRGGYYEGKPVVSWYLFGITVISILSCGFGAMIVYGICSMVGCG